MKPKISLTAKTRGKHIYSINKHVFEVDRKYVLTHLIGCGAYGIVCSGKNRKNNRKVAIKKIVKLFDDVVDGKRILREILLLAHFNHSNLLSIKDILVIQDYSNFNEIYIATELLDTDLHRVIRSNQKISLEHRQFFIYQILKGLKYIHSASVIHRDLKPSNILVNVNCEIKICDFGLARGVDPLQYPGIGMTEYVVTRWYRAPEILLVASEYTSSIDIWSVGCILAELINRKPLFAGDNYAEQITMILRVLGKPSAEDSSHITHPDCVEFLRDLPTKPPISFKRIVRKANQMELDLLEKMLVFNPKKRPTVEQLLTHPYFEELHNKESEITCPKKFKFEYDYREISKSQLRKCIYQQMLKYHPRLKDESLAKTI